MTERLYYENAYLTEFDGVVLECRPDGEYFQVLLDRSAFYPTSGGQPFDTGTLGGALVSDVNVENGDVWHRVDSALEKGTRVHGKIDWPRRFDHMQQHAGDHMIAGALHRMMGGVTIGLHVGADISTIDVSMPEGKTRISDEEIRLIEWDVNEHIQRNVPIRCWFPEEKELESLPLRKKPTVSEHVRIVAIGDDEMVACGGTHPAFAGEIGLVKILSVTPARGKMRLAFLAGKRALQDYFKCHEAAHEASQLLSSNVEKLAESVNTLQEKCRQAEGVLLQMKKDALLSRTDAFISEAEPLPDGSLLIARFVEADGMLLRELAAKMIERPGVIALLGAQKGDQALYVFGRSADGKADMGALLRKCARPYGGKGGGKPDFAQGGGSTEMLAEACRILKNNM